MKLIHKFNPNHDSRGEFSTGGVGSRVNHTVAMQDHQSALDAWSKVRQRQSRGDITHPSYEGDTLLAQARSHRAMASSKRAGVETVSNRVLYTDAALQYHKKMIAYHQRKLNG